MASNMKVISKASNEADTVAYVTIFSGNTSPCWVEQVEAKSNNYRKNARRNVYTEINNLTQNLQELK